MYWLGEAMVSLFTVCCSFSFLENHGRIMRLLCERVLFLKLHSEASELPSSGSTPTVVSKQSV
jgi:hypothetical protein